MKKLIFMMIIIASTYTVKSRVTKEIAPHYSGLSGRRYYIPREVETDNNPLVITVGDYTADYGSYLNYSTPQSAEEIAHEINRRKRVQQLQRSSKKPEGVTHEGEIVGIPLDFKPEYERIR